MQKAVYIPEDSNSSYLSALNSYDPKPEDIR